MAKKKGKAKTKGKVKGKNAKNIEKAINSMNETANQLQTEAVESTTHSAPANDTAALKVDVQHPEMEIDVQKPAMGVEIHPVADTDTTNLFNTPDSALASDKTVTDHPPSHIAVTDAIIPETTTPKSTAPVTATPKSIAPVITAPVITAPATTATETTAPDIAVPDTEFPEAPPLAPALKRATRGRGKKPQAIAKRTRFARGTRKAPAARKTKAPSTSTTDADNAIATQANTLANTGENPVMLLQRLKRLEQEQMDIKRSLQKLMQARECVETLQAGYERYEEELRGRLEELGDKRGRLLGLEMEDVDLSMVSDSAEDEAGE